MGDAPPHDCDLAVGMNGCIPRMSTGIDPGRDGVAFTPDDLDFQFNVMSELVHSRTHILGVYTNPVGFCTWQRWTEFTGGTAVHADRPGQLPFGTDLGKTLIELIRTPFVDGVTYGAKTPCDLQLSFDPPFIVGPIDVSAGARVSFLETIRVPRTCRPRSRAWTARCASSPRLPDRRADHPRASGCGRLPGERARLRDRGRLRAAALERPGDLDAARVRPPGVDLELGLEPRPRDLRLHARRSERPERELGHARRAREHAPPAAQRTPCADRPRALRRAHRRPDGGDMVFDFIVRSTRRACCSPTSTRRPTWERA
jgi:hypothetical protein